MKLPFHKKVSFRLMRATVGLAFLFGVLMAFILG